MRRNSSRKVHDMIRIAGGLSALTLATTLATPAAAGPVNADLPQVFTMSPTGVNLQDGRFQEQRTDIAIGSLAYPNGGPSASFGSDVEGGLSSQYGSGLWISQPSGSSPIYSIIVDGKTIKWTSAGSGTLFPWSEEGKGTELTLVNGKWQLLDRGGNLYQFMPHPALTSAFTNGKQIIERIDYADGSRLGFSYDSSARLRSVISNRGYALILDYTNGRLATACGYNLAQQYADANSTCGGSTLKATYSWTQLASGTWVVASVTDAGGAVTSFQYTANSLLSCITIPNTQTCRVTNYYGDQPGDSIAHTKPNQVRKQVMATGETWLFDYDNEYHPEIPLQPGETRYSWAYMTDPTGMQTSVRYANAIADQLYAPGANGSTVLTQYKFNGFTPKIFTSPEGNLVDLIRDERQNLLTKTVKAKPGSGLPDIVTQAVYPAVRYDPPTDATRPVGCQAASQKLCDKPTYTVDANNSGGAYATNPNLRADYEYDPASGLVLKETGPAVLVGGVSVRPQTRYTYAQRYAWVKNSAGTGYVAAATPIWLLTGKSFCKTGAAASGGTGCAIAGDEVTVSYDYGPNSGPNNLLLRGNTMLNADGAGQVVRSCYAYDAQGNKISETKPRAGLGSCP
jgi:YD repeat-containing protein